MASIRVTAIGRFLRVCNVRSDCDKRNKQNGHQAIVRSHLRTPHTEHMARPEKF
jgi:hypothetical protein